MVDARGMPATHGLCSGSQPHVSQLSPNVTLSGGPPLAKRPTTSRSVLPVGPELQLPFSTNIVCVASELENNQSTVAMDVCTAPSQASTSADAVASSNLCAFIYAESVALDWMNIGHPLLL